MRRGRFYLLAAVLTLAGVAGVVRITSPTPPPTSTMPTPKPVRVTDRRCRGGCSGSADAAYLRILQGGPRAGQQAAGTLLTNKGTAVTVTRASSKYCTNSSGTLVLLGVNTPCVEARGLLVEGSGTNALLNSAGSGSAWTQDGVTLTTGVAGPDGTTNAVTLTTVAGVANHRAYQGFTAVAGTKYPISVYAKAITGGAQFIGIGSASGVSYLAVFDVQGNTFVSGSSVNVVAGSSLVTPLGNGWFRYCAVVTAPVSAGVFFSIQIGETTATQAAGAAYSAAGGEAVALNGFQQETGPFCTSYIPTAGTAATRAGDYVTFPNPLTSGAGPWMLSWDVTPLGLVNVENYAFAFGTNGLANSFSAYTLEGASQGSLNVGAHDASNVASGFVSTPGTAGVLVSHHASASFVAGVINGAFDGHGLSSRSGTSPIGSMTQPATMTLGSLNAGSYTPNSEWLSNLCVGPPGACTP